MMAAALLLGAAASPSSVEARSVSARREDDVPMKAARIYDGIWLDMFEAQTFYPGANTGDEIDSRSGRIWLDIDRFALLRGAWNKDHVASRVPDPSEPRLYRIRFVGREARDMDCRRKTALGRGCYGHLGLSPGLIVAERIVHIVDLGTPPWINSDNRR